jgi:C4-dicarboxylate transporter DctM subunit
LILSLFLILGSGVWIGLTLSGVAWIGMQLFSRGRRATPWR